MFHEEEIALFALEEQFEQAATNPALTATARMQEMQAVLERMQATVMAGFRVDPLLGEHLADLALDYLAREDLAPLVVKNAFARATDGVVPMHGRLLHNEVRRAVVRISNSSPALAVMP
ncbi:MAG: hypothetical protein KJ667_04935 [Alphaproteobacteria bacterium]|nr:hypothetical protein [Alphaproteobacteria bacterium]